MGPARLFESFGEADEFVRHFLLCCSRGLLPLEGDEEGFFSSLHHQVNHVPASVRASAYLDLFGDLVAEVFE